MNELSFGRESFDRFGDDLCELILNYLPITDCFRFECVSKQWKALIFIGQKRLDIEDMSVLNPNPLDIINSVQRINASLFAYVLNKCSFINELIINKEFVINDHIINAIANNCSHLKSLTIGSILDISEHTLNRFGEKCGPKLETLDVNIVRSKILGQLLPLIPNLRKITINDTIGNMNLFITGANHTYFLPKLEEIGSKLLIYKSFIPFADQYRKQIKKLHLSCIVYPKDELENSFNVFRQLSKFECLQSIKINCSFIKRELTTFIRLLKSMASDCKNLTELKLYNIFEITIFDCFADGFESLQKLSLNNVNIDVNCANFECLKRCVNITHISVFQKLLHTNQFVNCDIFVPQLTSLLVSTEEAFTDDMLRCLDKLKHLRTLKLECKSSANKCKVSSTGICDLIYNCATLRKIHSSVKGIELITRKKLKKRAMIYIEFGEMLIMVKTLTNQLNHGVYYSSGGTGNVIRLFKCLLLESENNSKKKWI